MVKIMMATKNRARAAIRFFCILTASCFQVFIVGLSKKVLRVADFIQIGMADWGLGVFEKS